jgi:glycosyltransferase involved in cell wall biosynthesis
MRLAMVVTGGLHPSGREQVVPSLLALFERLAPTHEVHAFALRHLPTPQTYPLLGFAVHDLGRPSAPLGFRRRAQTHALRLAMQEHGPFDLVHGFWADPSGLLAARMGHHFGVPSVATCDSGEFVSMPEIGYGSQRTARGRAAVREACALATRVHVCTTFMQMLAARHGVTATVIPLGIAIQPPRRSRQPGATPLRLLQIASLSHVKNQVVLLEAVALLSHDIDVRLDLVGEDTLDGALHAYARDLGISDRVTFHGFVANDQHGPFLDADIYVQSSRHEAAAVSVLEAAAAGIPVVGTRVGYVADWSPDRAIAVDTNTPKALADAIRRLHTDRPLANHLAAAAQAWTHNHDADWTAAQFDQLYRELAERKDSRR